MRNNILYVCLVLSMLFGVQAHSQDNTSQTGKTFLKVLNNPKSFNMQNVNHLLHGHSGGLYKQGEWKQVDYFTDQLGISHYKYQLIVEDVPVLRHIYTVHVNGNKIQSISGEVSGLKLKNADYILSESQALDKALAHVEAKVYMWQDTSEEEHLKVEQHDPNASYYPKGTKAWLANGSSLVPVWQFDIYAKSPLSRAFIYVSAENGEVIESSPRIYHTTVTGTAQSAYNGVVDIQTDSVGPNLYQLNDASRGNGIITWNMQNSTSHANAVHFEDNDNVWNNFSPAEDIYAIDAHWGAIKTYDYYQTEHNRNSIDGNGFTLNSYVHYDFNYANAFWDGTRMTYGDGGGGISALTTSDIAGHEITHGLTNFTADLIYSYESGALNESFSDIFGTAIEFYAKPQSADWLVGAEIGVTLRSMSNPKQYGDPNCYLGDNWHTAPSDNGGVHINSGVQNFWYYLLVNGGTSTNDLGDAYSVSAIGMEKASAIAFRSLTVYLTPSSNFMDARTYAIQSAKDLYGDCSNEVTQTANAWYAVGVGDAYQPTVNAAFTANQKQACQAPLTVAFVNQSSHGISYLWDFGDGNTSTDINPVHTYNQNGNYTVTLTTNAGSCGNDSTEVVDFVQIDPDKPCVTTMVRNGRTATQTTCEGLILDSGGEGDYENNTEDEITIAPTGAGSVTLHFDEFDIEEGLGTLCNYDELIVYDGPSRSSSIIARYCNNNLPPDSLVVTNMYGAVTIVFESDDAVTRGGFKIRYNCSPSEVAPVADFDAEQNETCRGAVQFTDNSTYGATSWSWDFGDGKTSTDQNPNHWYHTGGVYTVVQTVQNSNGTDSKTKVNIVQVQTVANGGVNRLVGSSNIDTLVSLNAPGTSYWYNDLSQPYMDTGNQFLLDVNAPYSKVYLVQEQALQIVNGAKPDNNNGNNGNVFNNVQGLIFDVFTEAVLKSVKVYAGSPGNRLIVLQDELGNEVESKLVFVPSGESRVDIGFTIQPGSNYNLTVDNSETISMFRNNGGVNYPYAVGSIAEIKRSTANQQPFNYYYFFYDWEMHQKPCLSEVEEIDVDGINSVNEVGNSSFSIYPNPAENMVNISNQNGAHFELEILNVAGQLIYMNSAILDSYQVNTSDWAKGVYMVNIYTDGVKKTRKLVIQ